MTDDKLKDQRAAFDFLRDKFRTQEAFTKGDLQQKTKLAWKSITTYWSKQFEPFVKPVPPILKGVAQKDQKIDPSPEAEAIAGLQAAVRRKLGERGITVEVNPSSNLLIGDLGDLTQHPLWRLNPPPGVKVDAPPVSICIGSDNPLTFATNLPEEYQWLLDALVLAGCSQEQARQWLDRVRETGLENRFTVPRSEGLPITSLMNP